MEYVIVSITAFAAAVLAFFSGFGLGTLLLPVFVFFFPVEVAIAATAIVHLANNLFRMVLVGRYAVWRIVLRFGLPAVLFAIPGAWLLGRLTGMPVLYGYVLGSRSFQITPDKVAIGILILAFAVFDLVPRLSEMTVPDRYLPYGGAVSGFFGGISGHQGAVRSMFLVKTGMETDAFIGSNSVIAVGVDLSRLIVYGTSFYVSGFSAVSGTTWWVVLVGAGSAIVGSLIGSRFMKKVTIATLRDVIGALLVLVGVSLAAGLI